MAGELLKKMLARKGLSAADHKEFAGNSRMRKMLQRQGVPENEELLRVADLPRRQWRTHMDLDFYIESMTEWLQTLNGEQTLRPVQAMGLTDLHDQGGLLAPLPVGTGKTLLTFLAPVVMEAKRPLLVIPAKLRDKTLREFDLLEKHWRRHPGLTMVSYAMLGREKQAEYLDEVAPDMVIADEVHRFKNLKAASTRRMARYMETNPDTIFAGLSGTITKRSLMDFHHLLHWALGPTLMPLPADQATARLWSLAVDEKVPMPQRMKAGALKIFVDQAIGEPSIEDTRVGVANRIIETAGVVSSPSAGVDASILLEYWEPDPVLEVEEGIAAMGWDNDDPEKECVSPAGDLIVSGVDYWRHVREVSLGFCYTWRDPAPDEWMEARRSWRGFVREQLAEERPGMDSELQVTNACAAGRIDSGGLYEEWIEVRDQYKPVTVPVWLTTAVLEQIADQLIRKRTLVWVEHVVVGKKLSEITGIPFFHRGGKNQDGVAIEEMEGKGNAILSVASNSEGRNLQAWNDNVVLTPMATGLAWEQLFGRTHRPGQLADEIYLTAVMASHVAWNDMRQAVKDAEYLQALTQAPQKLLLADRSAIRQFD